jgi:hypothetical protein
MVLQATVDHNGQGRGGAVLLQWTTMARAEMGLCCYRARCLPPLRNSLSG